MRISAAPRILIVAGLCAAALIGLVVSEGFARDGGQEVTLPMAAVDPRALLSGHYVQLNFSQRVEPGDTCPATGDWEWVALRPNGPVHELAGGALSREQAQLIGPLPVKGSFACSPPVIPVVEGEAPSPGWLTLDLGINRFHINQADATRIETVLREQLPDQPARAFAVLSVGRDGRARLKALIIDDERFELSWL